MPGIRAGLGLGQGGHIRNRITTGPTSLVLTGQSAGLTRSITFSPSDITNLELWLRADTDVTHSSNAVSQWDDQSGIGDSNRNPVQTVGTNKPTLNPSNSLYNGRATIDFGANDFMNTPDWLASVPQPFWVALVCHTTVATGYAFDNNLHSNTPTAMLADSAGAEIACSGFFRDATYDLASPSLFIAEFNGASSKMRINSRSVTATGSVGTSHTLYGVTLGCLGWNLTTFWNGSQAEVIVASGSPVQSEINYLGDYVNQLYSISIA